MESQGSHFDETYYSNNGQIGDRPALRFYTRLVRRYLNAGPILDFGCGTGHLVKHLSRLGEADGFEVSEFSAEAARRNAPRARVFTDPAEIPDNGYASVTAIHVVEHLTDDVLSKSLETWHRILRPAGRVLVVTPDLAGYGRALAQDSWGGFSDPTHINLKPHADWRRCLEDSGFSVEKEGSDGLWDVPYRRLPKLVDGALHAGPSLAQFIAGRLFLPPGSGESSIFVLSRST